MVGIHPESICKQGCCDPSFVLLDVLEAPDPDAISLEKCTPTVALPRCRFVTKTPIDLKFVGSGRFGCVVFYDSPSHFPWT